MKGRLPSTNRHAIALFGGLFLVFLSSLVLGSLFPLARGFYFALAFGGLFFGGLAFLFPRLRSRLRDEKKENGSKTPLHLRKIVLSDKLKPTLFKAGGALLLLLYLAHYIGGHDYLAGLDGLSSSSFMAPPAVFFALLGTLLFQATAVLASISSFLDTPFFKGIRNRLLFPLALLCFLLAPFFLQAVAGDVFGSGAFEEDPHGFRLPLMGIELALVFLFPVVSFHERKDRLALPSPLPSWILLFFVVFLSLPNSYSFAVLFGSYQPLIPLPLDINWPHRVLIYLAFLLPVAYYFLLRPFSLADRRGLLCFLAYMSFFGYVGDLRYDIWTNLETLPLHLCNTAMYVIPLVLTFKTTKVFYFTMFINVIGAFLALLMPNYSSSLGAFSVATAEFYINHLYAFFMPVLIVLLGIYPRPKMKYFFYSMAGFLLYFLFCLVVNTAGTAYGYDVDFFFLNTDYVAGEIGDWAKEIFNVSFSFEVNGRTFVVHPPYLVCFYLVYVGFAFLMWYVYELLFRGVDELELLLSRSKAHRELAKERGKTPGKEKEAMASGTYLRIEHLRKRYPHNDFDTVKDFSLELEGGKIYAFLGKNGAGKSTIIKSIVGMHDFDGGKIVVAGYDLQEEEVAAKSLIGFVPDHYALYESLTGREYVGYIADLYGVARATREKRLADLLPRLSLEAAFDRPIGTYSHGMKQKITIVSSLIHDPRVWILDEPMTGVDPVSIYEIKETMREHASKGNIVFFSTHLIDVVSNLCDEIIVIRKGDLVYRGEVSALHERGIDLEQLFLRLGEDGKGAVKPE